MLDLASARRLHTAIAAVCPILGMDVGTEGSSPSVTFLPVPAATTQQRTVAQGVIDGFDWSDAAQAAWELSQNRTQADTDITQGSEPVHISARAGDVAVWTYGINNLLEWANARLALAAGGNWSPTADQLAAQITTARTSYTVDAAAPTPAQVAALMTSGGRLLQPTILGLTEGVLVAGGGDPITS
jgi:hypothetical protein